MFLSRTCLAISRAADKFVKYTVCSRLSSPVNLPVFTSITVSASHFSIIRFPPFSRGTFGEVTERICSLMPSSSNISLPVSCKITGISAAVGISASNSRNIFLSSGVPA